jgi:hypothetical protein
MVNGTWKMRLNTDSTLDMSTGGSYDGNWNNASSIAYKDNVVALEAGEAMAALGGLEAVRYTYRVDDAEEHVGFIAEDVPELVASSDRKTVSPMDIVGVLTKVVQEQQESIGELHLQNERLEAENADLQERLLELERLVAGLVSR